MKTLLLQLGLLLLLSPALAQTPFSHELKTDKKPWTSKAFDNAPDQFQFAIVSDRTGGMRPGIFEKAVEKLNLLHPEFVMCVGDLIEGYTKNQDTIQAQWSEWDSILGQLQTRFFALPGNHDISNEVMRQTWIDRYGQAYYHFRYKDVLFLAFDSNDGDGVMFSREQLEYFKQTIRDNADVRWTLLFMHHPIWNYRDFNGFTEIEEALKNRPYTVFAGHTHRYFYNQRQERNYYILGSTGGGSQLRGPRFGEFDHVSWVTMTANGPEVAHLQLQGILASDVLNPATAPLAASLLNAAKFDALMLKKDEQNAKAIISLSHLPAGSPVLDEVEDSAAPGTRTAEKPLFFEAQFYHHHHASPNPTKIKAEIKTGSTVDIPIDIRFTGLDDGFAMDDLELDWQLRADGPFLEPPFALHGMLKIRPDYFPSRISFSSPDIFLDKTEVLISHPYQDVQLRYTLDGSNPTWNSPRYTAPFLIDQTTTVKVCIFDASGQYHSDVVEKTYRKVKPLEALSLKKTRLKNGLKYRYYELENPKSMPTFSQLKPVKSGTTNSLDVEALAGRIDHYGIQFEGLLEVPMDGIYTFYTHSDDGSNLYIHGQAVVDNDGSHEARTRYGAVALKKGLHPVRIDYFEDFLGQSLEIGFQIPGETKERPLSASMFMHQP